MNNSWLSSRESRKGQSLVEFALITTFVLLFLSAASFEAARYSSMALRIASSVREAGRLFVAEEISPSGVDVSANQIALYAQIKTKVYDPTVQMVYPADFPRIGTMVVSIIKRYDPSGNTAYNPSNLATGYSEYDPATETDDQIKVEYQFKYDGTESDPTWVSTYGPQNTTIMSLPLSTLRVDERAVIVEMYYKVESIFPESALNTVNLKYIYDKAIF